MANAGTVYSNVPNTTTGNSYKNAAVAYFETFEGMTDCFLPANQAEFKKAIELAKKDIDEINCDSKTVKTSLIKSTVFN